MALKFGRWLHSIAAEIPVIFQDRPAQLNIDLATSRLNEIWDVFPLLKQGTGLCQNITGMDFHT